MSETRYTGQVAGRGVELDDDPVPDAELYYLPTWNSLARTDMSNISSAGSTFCFLTQMAVLDSTGMAVSRTNSAEPATSPSSTADQPEMFSRPPVSGMEYGLNQIEVVGRNANQTY